MGKIVTIADRFHIPYFNHAPRRIFIYLPTGYVHRPTERFPVLYMHDGQNLFFDAHSFLGVSWGVKQTMERLERTKRSPGILVVGIENAGRQREMEYSMLSFRTSRAGGKTSAVYGASYCAFLTETLKPWVDATFRTRPEREWTWMAGSSAGANISLFAGLWRPDVFSALGLFSPAMWLFDRSDLMKFFDAVNWPLATSMRYFLYVGTEEGEGERDRAGAQRYLDGTIALQRALLERGVPVDSVAMTIGKGYNHNEWSWREQFPNFVPFIVRR